MCQMTRPTRKPCFASKIPHRRTAPAAIGLFVFMYQNIKPQDGVIIGMFPSFKDEITQNAPIGAQSTALGRLENELDFAAARHCS